MFRARHISRTFFSALLLALTLTSSAQAADSGIEAARRRGVLVVGLSHPLAAYVAGARLRTPERPDPMLVETLAKRLHVSLVTPKVEGSHAAQWLKSGHADIVLALVGDSDTLALQRDAAIVTIPTGYSTAAMAIARSDTSIKRWEQLKGRTVCLSEGGAHVGKIAAHYGAIEKVQRAPADSLLSLRIGACDVAVHDDTMLDDLLKLPEWKKFSARLPTQGRQRLVFAVRADDAGAISYLRRAGADWVAGDFWHEFRKTWANNVAFEVYLDQHVPDCH